MRICLLDISSLHEKARKGDSAAENQLFGLLTVRFRYLATLRLGNATDAEEVTQEALMVISREFRQITIESSFAAWAFKVLDNRLRNFARSRNREKKTIGRNLKGDQPFLSDDQLKGRLLDCLRKINELNPRYARILNLHHQGYTTDEICKKIGITPGNFYVILSRARSLLQECLNIGDVE